MKHTVAISGQDLVTILRKHVAFAMGNVAFTKPGSMYFIWDDRNKVAILTFTPDE